MSIQEKILALKVGDVVRIESSQYGNGQFTVDGIEDDRESKTAGLRVFQAWGNAENNAFILLEAGEDAMSLFVPSVLEVVA